jgi:hypothetical protein
MSWPSVHVADHTSYDETRADHFSSILQFFAQRYPRYLLRLVNRHEEVYALFMLLVEGYHLRRLGSYTACRPCEGNLTLNEFASIFSTDSTFADQFYGMRYRSSLPDRPSARPSSRQKALILAFIVSLSRFFSAFTLQHRLVICLT